MNELLDLIHKDIISLYEKGINEKSVKVSIPKWVIDLMKINYLGHEESIENSKCFLFGCEVVEGCTAQICVFYSMGKPNECQLNPIKLIPNYFRLI